MNRFIKGCLFTAGIVAAIGLVFFVLGAVFGGIRQVVNIGQNGGFHCVDISPQGLHIAVDSDGVDVDDYDTDDFDMDDFDTGYNISEDLDSSDMIDYEDESLGTADDIDSIDVHLGAGELNICETEEDEFLLETDQVYRVKCYRKDQVLHIYCRGISDDDNTFRKQHVTLYIPKGVKLQDTDIELGAGAGRIEDIQTNDLSIELGAGELKGKAIKASSADIQVGAGVADFKDCVLGDVKYEVGLGSVYYQGSINKDVDINCNMGSVELNLDGDEEDFDYRIECSMGTVEIEGRRFTGITGDRKIDNSAEQLMDMECSMANISVNFN